MQVIPIEPNVLPSEALSEQMYVFPESEEGKTVIVVKLEYVSYAYLALRHVAIHLFETQQKLKLKDEETDEVVNTFKVLVAYINGREFQQGIRYIDNAIKDAEATRNQLNQMKSYINTKIDTSVKLQNSVEESLNHAKDLVGRLRTLLNGSTTSLEQR